MPAGYVTESESDTDQLDAEGSEIDSSDGVIPGALQSANCRVWSTRELYERMNKALIDVEPPYQRDVVWSKPAQSSLIDSILKNKWVPTLLFSERPACVDRFGRKRKARWVCMDGKQRLTSIRLFMDGVIPWYMKPKQPLYFKQSDPPQPSRRLLTEEQQEVFLSRGLTAAMYSQLTELQERDIFRLVQEGKPLTTGEKMQASSGLWSIYVNELTAHYMSRNDDKPNGWSGRISNLKRGSDYKTMAEMVMTIRDRFYNGSSPSKYWSYAKVQKEIDSLAEVEVPQDLQNRVKFLLDYFMDLSTLAPPKTPYTIEMRTPDALYLPIQRGKRTMIAPIEMVWIPQMIAVHSKDLSKGKLLEMVEMYKIAIRKKFPNEVKSNATLVSWTVDWIQTFDVSKLTGKYTGWAVPRPTPQPASQEVINSAGSGLRDMARRNLTTQTSNNNNKRETPVLDPTLAQSPGIQNASQPKRPRLTAPVPTSQPALNSSIPFMPHRNSVSKDPSFASRPVSQGRPNPNPSTNLPPAGDKAKALAQRAHAAVHGNGSSLALHLMGNGQQSSPAPSFTSQTSAHHTPDPGTAPLGAPQTRFVPNYPPQMARQPTFQLPSKPQQPIPQQQMNQSITQQPMNGSTNYRTTAHSNPQNLQSNSHSLAQSHVYQGQQQR